MANTREELLDRFFVVNGAGMVQAAKGIGLDNADLDTRDKCNISHEFIVTRRESRDCRNEYIRKTKQTSRYSRYTLNYDEFDPQILFRWTAIKQGAVTSPTGSSVNEVQRLTKAGSFNPGDTYKLAMTLEGISVQTKPIAYDSTTDAIVDALTAARMAFIEPGDVAAVGGTKQVETLVIVGTVNASGNLPVTVIAAGSPALLTPGKTINVAILDTDSASVVAGKVRVALAADTDVSAFFTVSGAGANVILTAIAAAANDLSMAVSNTAVLGMTAATSANTTPGVAQSQWGSNGVTLTFENRLANANLPMLTVDNSGITGGGSISVSQITAGDQNYHTSTIATSRQKLFTSFALGWDDDETRVEKYIDFAVESIVPTINRDGNATLVVTLTGPCEPDSIETDFDIPDCENIEPLLSQDCRLKINSNWETEDLTAMTATVNDSIPFDRLSAFPFIGVDIQTQRRGPQPGLSLTASIIAAERDSIYGLAFNERTEDAVGWIIHFGMPGNRCTWNFPATEVHFQNNPTGNTGTAQINVVNLDGVPTRDGSAVPMNAEAWLDQSTPFLATS